MRPKKLRIVEGQNCFKKFLYWIFIGYLHNIHFFPPLPFNKCQSFRGQAAFTHIAKVLLG